MLCSLFGGSRPKVSFPTSDAPIRTGNERPESGLPNPIGCPNKLRPLRLARLEGTDAKFMETSVATSKSARGAALAGAGLGFVISCPAFIAALLSMGGGHGHYSAARIFFPGPMLLTLIEGQIGAICLVFALLQFPLYGLTLGWCFVRENYLPAAVLLALHVVATLACFSGAIPNFS